MCSPLPVTELNGFGMNVATMPASCASMWIMYRKKMVRSAVVSASE